MGKERMLTEGLENAVRKNLHRLSSRGRARGGRGGKSVLTRRVNEGGQKKTNIVEEQVDLK